MPERSVRLVAPAPPANSDCELWLASSTADQWQIPVYAWQKVIEGTTEAFYWVENAIGSLTADQFLTVAHHFGPHRLNQEGNFWIIPFDSLAQIARKAPGITAAHYLIWKGEAVASTRRFNGANQDPVDTTIGSSAPPRDAELFLRYMAKTSPVFSYETLKVIWIELNRVATRWLAIENKPLDLGFCQITPLPYRLNWKEVMIAAYPKLPWLRRQRKLGKMTEEQRHALLIMGGVYDFFQNLSLSEFTLSKKVCNWNLDVLPSTELRAAFIRQQRLLMRVSGQVTYAQRHFDALQRLAPQIVELMDFYCEKITRPCADSIRRAGTDGVELIPFVPEGEVRPACPVFTTTRVVHGQIYHSPSTRQKEMARLRIARSLAKENPGMFQLPDVQRSLVDVRNPRRDHAIPGAIEGPGPVVSGAGSSADQFEPATAEEEDEPDTADH